MSTNGSHEDILVALQAELDASDLGEAPAKPDVSNTYVSFDVQY
jgi:hypothetical protein